MLRLEGVVRRFVVAPEKSNLFLLSVLDAGPPHALHYLEELIYLGRLSPQPHNDPCSLVVDVAY